MKQLEHSMETRLETLYMLSIMPSAKVNAIIEFFPCTNHLTHRRFLWPADLAVGALDGTVTSEVGIPVLSDIPIGRSCMEYGPET